MAITTGIEWTDSTFNPWIGCTNVSPGCDHCYAEVMNAYRHWTQWRPHGERHRTSAATWKNPIKWQADAPRFQRENGRRQRVFCASLADVCDNQAPAGWRADLYALIRATPDLDWQILTKRPQNIARFLPADWGDGYPNVWLGATTEDQHHFDQRWPSLLSVPAAVRFVSYEPGPGALRLPDRGPVPDWIISGGESGAAARAMNPQWARDLRDDCQRRGIPLFHKQWGSYASNPLCFEARMTVHEAEAIDGKINGKGGALLDDRLWREFPRPRAKAGENNRPDEWLAMLDKYPEAS